MARAQDAGRHAARVLARPAPRVFVCWNAGTLAGALAGSRPRRSGARSGSTRSFPAAFLALLAPQLRQPRRAGAPRWPAPLIALVLLPFAPAGVPVMARARSACLPVPAEGARVSWAALLALCAAPTRSRRPGRARGRAELGPLRARSLDLVAVPLLGRADRRPDARRRRRIADARLPALAVAAVLVWRRAPFLVVVLAAAATAALLRAVA